MEDKLSALLDGELEDEAVAAACEQLGADAASRADWQTWCLIGDALRDEHDGGADLSARVLAALADEPTVLAPGALQRKPARSALVAKLMPLAASVMGVAAVGLVAASLFSHESPPALGIAALPAAPAPVARAVVAPAPAVAAGGSVEIQLDEALSEYLIAHQGASAGAMPAGMQYVRTVSLASGGGR